MNLPYYNPEFMRVFKKPEEIDPEWIRKNTEVDYEYKGEFGLEFFFDFISQSREGGEI